MSPMVLRRMPFIFAVPPVVLVLLTVADTHAGVRSIAALAFLLLCPGWPWMWAFSGPDPLVTLILAVAASITLDVLVSEAMILSHLWSPRAGFVLLSAIGGLGLALGHRRKVWNT
jgi:uncharacterized membrane protein